MDELDRMIEECKKDTSFKKAWDESEEEYNLNKMIINKYIHSNANINDLAMAEVV